MDISEIIKSENQVIIQTYRRFPVEFVRGEGCYLFDSEGKRYLDLVAGVAVNSLGHSHPEWVKAVQKQASELVHVSNLYYTRPMIELAAELCRISGMDRVFFCNSGTEANEAAIKAARKWGRKKRGPDCHRIITFEKAFHGRTLGALSATGQKNYCEPFEPLIPGFIQVRNGDLERINSLLDGTVCAVMVETIQGEGGVLPFEPVFLQNLRKLCDTKNVLLIIDEVQTGIGRTGEWFGYQHFGILPDLSPLAKGLGGGFPIGACLSRGEAATSLEPGDHGSTFAAGPLAATAALTVLRVMRENNIVEHVRETGEFLRGKLEGLCLEFNVLDHVRGAGLMLGLEFREPVARDIVTKALERGLVLNATGDTTLRLIPPLILEKSQVAEAVEILTGVLREL